MTSLCQETCPRCNGTGVVFVDKKSPIREATDKLIAELKDASDKLQKIGADIDRQLNPPDLMRTRLRIEEGE